jgi:phage tail-like protein
MAADEKYKAQDPLLIYAFHVELGSDLSFDGYFTEIDLPTIEWDMQEVKEGGLNTYAHQLPGRRKPAKLTLKHGLSKKAELLAWYEKLMNEKFFNYKQTISITMVDRTDQYKDVLKITVHDASLTKITWPQLKAGDNTVAIQSVEFACGDIQIQKLK